MPSPKPGACVFSVCERGEGGVVNKVVASVARDTGNHHIPDIRCRRGGTSERRLLRQDAKYKRVGAVHGPAGSSMLRSCTLEGHKFCSISAQYPRLLRACNITIPVCMHGASGIRRLRGSGSSSKTERNSDERQLRHTYLPRYMLPTHLGHAQQSRARWKCLCLSLPWSIATIRTLELVKSKSAKTD